MNSVRESVSRFTKECFETENNRKCAASILCGRVMSPRDSPPPLMLIGMVGAGGNTYSMFARRG
jgi:hypothetical protein